MVSTELLRRFPFFGFMNDAQLKAVAMIAEEVPLTIDMTILEAGQMANALYILTEGHASNYCVASDEHHQGYYKEFFINDIEPGEIFGISALIEPYQYTATIRASKPGRTIRINASQLRSLCEVDPRLAFCLMREVAKAASERLIDTYNQLAAARV
jgi:CRP-like cAMP-binding protein